MKDVNIAREVLEEKGYTLVIVKEGNIVFTSKDKGIKPLYKAVTNIKDKLKGASIADRVIGKAAAMLCVYGNIEEVYTRLISEDAIKTLDQGKIKVTYEEKSPYIKNRNQTDMCPVEKMSKDTNDINILFNKIEKFLHGIKG